MKHQKNRRQNGCADYGNYRFSRKEWMKYTLIYLGLDALISELFFRSFLAFGLFLPGMWIFFQDRKKLLREKRAEQMQNQFLTGMQLVETSLQAGYAIENAFREAIPELEKIYEKESFILREFYYLVNQNHLNRPMEVLLLELGQRSHVEDIQSFAEVFYIAKRTRGDLIGIVQNTVSCILQKQETRKEIDTSLAGKRMEQNLMSVIPLFILGYVKLSSPGFLDPLYHNTIGILVMSACFVGYLLAYFWGRKIMHIQV